MKKEKEQIDSRILDIDNTSQGAANFSGLPSSEASNYSIDISDITKAKYALSTAHFIPDPEGLQRAIYFRYPELDTITLKGKCVAKTKTKIKAKISTVMSEFKKKELNIGKSSKKVTTKKQALAIALSEAGVSKKTKKKRRKKKK